MRLQYLLFLPSYGFFFLSHLLLLLHITIPVAVSDCVGNTDPIRGKTTENAEQHSASMRSVKAAVDLA